MTCPTLLRSVALSALLAVPAWAQWSDDPMLNTPVAVAPGFQDVPELAVRPDGSTWIAWFDKPGFLDPFALRLQLLDQAGVALFPTGGLLVSDHPSMINAGSLDLVSDASGDCVLILYDLRDGPDSDAYAYRIDSSGAFLWGPDGVALSSDTDNDYGPRVSRNEDGSFVFAWHRVPSSPPGSLRLQVLEPDGNKRLGVDGMHLFDPTGNYPSTVDVVSAPDGGWILAWVSGVFGSPLLLRTQRFTPDGNATWGPDRTVFAGVELTSQPRVASDGAGGAVFAWSHSIGGPKEISAQHIAPDGSEAYPPGGSAVSLEPDRLEWDPTLCFDRSTGEASVFFVLRDLGLTKWGLRGQRFSPTGERLWGDSGTQLTPFEALFVGNPQCVDYGGGALVCARGPSTIPSYDRQRILAQRVDAAGDAIWPTPVFLSSGNIGKSDLQLDVNAFGMGVAVWVETSSDPADVVAQNVNPDGSLGLVSGCSSSVYCLGAPNSVGNGAKLGASGAASVGFGDFTLEASAAPPANLGLFVMGDSQAQTPFGDGTLCVGGSVLRFLPPSVIAPAGTAAHALDFDTFPADQIAPGSTWNFQFWYRDPSGPLGTGFNLSDALSVSFCP